MRKGVFISLGLHGLVILLVFIGVSFNQVTYLPRETYRVRIVAAAIAEPVTKSDAPAAAKEEPKPAPTPPKEEPKDDELTTPAEKPKPKPNPKPPKETKEVPRAQVTKGDADTASTATDTAGAAPGATEGGISFDGGDFPYNAFIARMRQKIAAAWRVPAGSEGIERFAVVYFRVHRDGNITHVSVEKPSGVFMFDQSCQRAVIESAPFPPLPREYDEEYVGVHFSFKYVPSETP